MNPFYFTDLRAVFKNDHILTILFLLIDILIEHFGIFYILFFAKLLVNSAGGHYISMSHELLSNFVRDTSIKQI